MTEQRYASSFGAGGTLVYDLKSKELVRELSEYSVHLLSREQVSSITERLRMEHLIEFWKYLSKEKLTLRKLSDDQLELYRDRQLPLVKGNPRSIGSEGAAKETVNAKLISIYRWLMWLQENGRLSLGTIGPTGCRITVVPDTRYAHRKFGHGTVSYPVLYRKTGRKSKHRASLAPTREQLDEVAAKLMERENEYAGLRDSLVLDIAVETGMRRASINSLRASMFDRVRLEKATGSTFLVCPPSQKFGYEEDVRFPVWLGLRVADFIAGAREDFLKSKPHLQDNADDRIFLSTRDCAPLTNRALSQTISAAMRAVGLPKGVAIHSGRRLFAAERIETEIDRRIELGLDTSTDSICAAVSIEMGHHNPESLFPYVSRSQSRRAMEAAAAARKRPTEDRD